MSAYASQKKLIEKGKWDCLVVLDACRYDFFESIYNEFFTGILKKVISEGTDTRKWLNRTFEKEYQDVVYVSGNPYVSSNEFNNIGFEATKHFHRVIDVWNDGWNGCLQTVPPKKVSKSTRMARAKYPAKRIISHFIQPHYPYLTVPYTYSDMGLAPHYNWAKGKEKRGTGYSSWPGIFTVLEKLIGSFLTYKLRKALKLRKSGPVELVAQRQGDEFLRNAYRDNLKLVLEEVKKMIGKLPGKVVITADHGELLGESGLYEHPPEFDNLKILREVPWLEVSG